MQKCFFQLTSENVKIEFQLEICLLQLLILQWVGANVLGCFGKICSGQFSVVVFPYRVFSFFMLAV